MTQPGSWLEILADCVKTPKLPILLKEADEQGSQGATFGPNEAVSWFGCCSLPLRS
jgi:hypothetical protein